MNKKLLFISHAAPEDNYLAGWIASKLKLLGYEVWVDVKDLRAGSSFWNEIELKMRNDSIRVLVIVSEKYISKYRDKNTGVFSEVILAKTLSKKTDKFIIPIKADDSNYDDFPINILPLNTINFSNNLGIGLKDLIIELEEQAIPKGILDISVLTQWHEYQKIQGKVLTKREFYGSNWFEITIPKFIYIYKFIGEYENLFEKIPFSFVRDGDYLIGFFTDSGLDFHHLFSEKIVTNDCINNEMIELSNGDLIKDIPQKLVNLLNKSLNNHFHNLENFGVFHTSNKKQVFYVKYDENRNGYISLKAFGKRGRKLYSKDGKIKWRFGLSFLFQLTPFPHLVTNYHLISSDKHGLLNKDNQLKARRSIPNGWYNRDWYERILAFLHLASNSSSDLKLKVPVGMKNLVIDLKPIQFKSDYGYEEK